jgi:hypothetical protein
MGRSILALAGVAVMVVAVGEYVHARSRTGEPVACHISTLAATTPVKTYTPYTDPADGIAFNRPAGWSAGKGQTSVVSFTDPKSSVELCLDVPTLPAMAKYCPIPMFKVSGDYVADLKKKAIPDATSDPVVDLTTVPASSAREVRCHGHTPAGRTVEDSAVLVVHDHRIFILSVDSSADDAAKARSALDQAVASIQWTR